MPTRSSSKGSGLFDRLLARWRPGRAALAVGPGLPVTAGGETREQEIKVAQGLGAVKAAEWDACANPGATRAPPTTNPPPHAEVLTEGRPRSTRSGEASFETRASPAPQDEDVRSIGGGSQQTETYNPFVSHAFLSALEESGSVGSRTGWSPVHVLVEDGSGRLQAAAPCYLKSHSMGEYVFDGGWADAYERAGGRYYPKLQVSVPFTPVTGPRILLRPDAAPDARELVLAGLKALQRQLDASSTHLTFVPQAESEDLATRGFLTRTDRQFHWLDEGFGDFEGFLAALASRKRKAIRRERRDALASGITIEWATGSDITEAHWDAFYAFYIDTGSRKWGRPYLTRRFFSLVGERMAERILLVTAHRAGRPIAGAINFIGDVALYGRNWGCLEQHPFLHFEVCYYQAIDFALSRGLTRVEAGAQGEHKLARGYRPVTTYSAHDIADPGLKRAIADYLKRERAYVAAASDEYEEVLPFRKAE